MNLLANSPLATAVAHEGASDSAPLLPRTLNDLNEVAVLGGGISGLTAALRLAEAGLHVILIEGSEQLGGLGTFFGYEDRTFERFYHCMLPSDKPLLDLLDHLSLRQSVYWRPSSFGYAHQGDVFPLNQPKDLLAFAPLSFPDRFRVGVSGLYGRWVSEKGLDDITAVDWLTKLSGPKAFKTFWEPMLRAKFGDRFASVPALWFWTRFNREKGDKDGEIKGYLRGGYKRIIDTLSDRLKSLGAEVRLNEPARSIDLTPDGRVLVETSTGRHTTDRVVSTLPFPTFVQTAGPALRRAMGPVDTSLDYQGVINSLLFLRRPLSHHYWVATPEKQFPFDGIVETSTLTDEMDRGDRHVVYLTRYLHRHDPRFGEADETIASRDWEALKHIFPDLVDEEREAHHVFRSPFVEPLYRLGHLRHRPPQVLVQDRVYLASTAQVYPDVTSWNGSVALVNHTLDIMLGGRKKIRRGSGAMAS
jgi:protoporphyrinogen oxidase